MTSEAVIRRAGAADARAIAEVHVESWRVAYRGLMPDEVLDGLDVRKRTQQWGEWLALPGLTTFLATVDGEAAAFCTLGPARDGDAPEDVGEIPAIYVHPSHWRRGLGRALCERAMAEAGERGFAEVTLWVLDTNAHARRFYEALGFRVDGAAKTDSRLTGAPLRELRYRHPTAT